jgi:hypothetical protein
LLSFWQVLQHRFDPAHERGRTLEQRLPGRAEGNVSRRTMNELCASERFEASDAPTHRSCRDAKARRRGRKLDVSRTATKTETRSIAVFMQ